MGEFFRGWKRKIGCVTLVMALVFMMGWVRSLINGHQVGFAIDNSDRFLTSNHFVTSKDGFIRWTRYGILSNGVNPTSVDPNSIWTRFPLGSPSEPIDEPKNNFGDLRLNVLNRRFLGEHYWHWRWQWLQFDFGKGQAYGDAPMRVWAVPYWSITIPLTFISAFLLLTKPRKATPMKITEPIPVEGA